MSLLKTPEEGELGAWGAWWICCQVGGWGSHTGCQVLSQVRNILVLPCHGWWAWGGGPSRGLGTKYSCLAEPGQAELTGSLPNGDPCDCHPWSPSLCPPVPITNFPAIDLNFYCIVDEEYSLHYFYPLKFMEVCLNSLAPDTGECSMCTAVC